MSRTANPYRGGKHYQFIHEGVLLYTKYCKLDKAEQIAEKLEQEKWLKIGSVLIIINPNT